MPNTELKGVRAFKFQVVNQKDMYTIISVFVLLFVLLYLVSRIRFSEGFQDSSGNQVVVDSMKVLLNTVLPKLKIRSDDETEIMLATNDLSESELIEQELTNQLKKSVKEEVLGLRNKPLLPYSTNATSFSLEQGIQSQSNLPTIGR